MSIAEELIPPRPAPVMPSSGMRAGQIAGYGVLAIWFLLAVALVWMVVHGWSADNFAKYGPRYLHGLWTTVWLVVASISIGAILSLPLAFARLSKNRIISSLAFGYVYLFRGTPLLAQLYLVYYGLGSFRAELQDVGLWWFFREATYCGLLTMALNTAAYQAEILRGAIESVPRGQHEGAASLGIGKRTAFLKVILPQAMIVALRPYGNEIILMIKGSSVVSVVTVFDLMGETRYAFSRTFDYQTYLWAAIFYLAMVEGLRNVWSLVEARLTRHLKR